MWRISFLSFCILVSSTVGCSRGTEQDIEAEIAKSEPQNLSELKTEERDEVAARIFAIKEEIRMLEKRSHQFRKQVKQIKAAENLEKWDQHRRIAQLRQNIVDYDKKIDEKKEQLKIEKNKLRKKSLFERVVAKVKAFLT